MSIPTIHQFIYHWFCEKNLSKNMEVRSPGSGFTPYVKKTSEKAKHIRNHYNIQRVFRRYTSLGLCSWEKHHEVITNRQHTAFIACPVNVAEATLMVQTDQQECTFRDIGKISKQVLHKNLHGMQITSILGHIISSSGSTIFFHISS
jgi:hypothetical protein